MGVYIDMEMQKKTYAYCMLIKDIDGSVQLHVCTKNSEEISEWEFYDLVHVPEPHGRPVVLCRDCKYAPSGTDDGEGRGFDLEWPHDEWPEDNPCPCKCDDGWYSHKPAPDFFCAAGEKREENKE